MLGEPVLVIGNAPVHAQQTDHRASQFVRLARTGSGDTLGGVGPKAGLAMPRRSDWLQLAQGTCSHQVAKRCT